MIAETRIWLEEYPEPFRLYTEAFGKKKLGVFQRNVLDDMRLALEKLLQEILGNQKSLENQVSQIGRFIKERGGSREFSNLFQKMLDYYAKYQNDYVKHDDPWLRQKSNSSSK